MNAFCISEETKENEQTPDQHQDDEYHKSSADEENESHMSSEHPDGESAKEGATDGMLQRVLKVFPLSTST